MGSSKVLIYAGEPDTSTNVVAGAALLSKTWHDTANLLNLVLSKGAVVVPYHAPMAPATSIVSYTMTYWVEPHSQALQRVWIFRVSSGGALYGISLNGSSVITGSNTAATTYVYIEALGAQSDSATTNTVLLGATSSGSGPKLLGVGCYDVPRADLSDSLLDSGIYVPGFDAGQRVTYGGAKRLLDTLDGSSIRPGAKMYLNWSGGVSSAGIPPTAWSTASTSMTDLWTAAVPILGRKIYRSDTTREIYVKVYALVTAGTGQVQVVTTSGGTTSAQSVTSTTGEWLTFTTTVDCTDVDSADGRQTAASPGWDDLKVQYKHNTGGADKTQIVSVAAFDKPFDPLSLSPTVWLRADLGVTTSSGLVTDWADQSGNVNDFTQAVAADQPGLITAMNGEKAVLFNGATHMASAASLTLPTNYVIWAVFKPRDPGSAWLLCQDAGGTEKIAFTTTSDNIQFTIGGNADTTATAPLDTVASVMMDASSYPAGTGYLYNVAVASMSGADSSPVSGTFYLGSNSGGTAEAEMDLYEFAIFDSANVGATERAQLEAYARKRYYTEDFTPLDLRPEIWVRGDKGASISAWLDQSGNGRNFSQATGSAQPALETGTCGQVGFRFASGDYFASDASYTLPTTHLIWAVVEVDSGATSTTGYIWYSGTFVDSGAHIGSGGKVYFSAVVGGAGSITGSSDPSGVGTIVVAASDEGSTETLYINNVLEASASNATSGGAGTIYLGNVSAGTAPFQGIIYEYAVFDRSKIVAADIDALYAYAAKRYSIDDDFNMLTDTSGYPLLDTDSTILRDAN